VYFDTMRDMRLKRQDINAEFKKRFCELSEEVVKRVRGAEDDGKGKGKGKGKAAEEPELKLEMLDETALEESLAVTNMVSKIRGVCHDELFPLDKRMAVILGKKAIAEDDNPLGPQIVCQAFHDSCSVVQTSVEVKLIILKLFDIHVVGETQELYEEINDLLVEKGVLPTIKREVVKRAGGDKGEAKKAPAEAAQAGEQGAPAGDDLASAGLMNALQQVMNATAGSVGAVSEVQAQARQTEVLGSLTALQTGNAPAAGGVPIIDPALVGAGNTNVLRELKAANVTEGMGQVDVVMFDVVSMMFDFILDDENVPDPMKALIGRLQIPMLKVALIDKTFFSKKSHPARKLLNTLAEAALGWNEDHDDGGAYYGQVEAYVRKVLEEFEDSVEVFDTVLEQLEAFLADQEQVAEESTQGSANAIESRERLEQARIRAQEAMQKSFHGKPTPEIIRKFFHTRWKELLVFCYFDEGEDGEGWKKAVETMDQIIWSLTPISDPEDRKKLVKLLPGLLNRVKDGMKQISLPAKERKQFLAALANHHLAAVRAGSGESDAVVPAQEPPADAQEETVNGIELLLKQAVERANAVIHHAAESKPECAGMGTTLVAARFHDNRVTVAHVGDSRLYRMKGGRLEQLTLDHSLMQDLINKGFYTPEEAKKNVKSNVITRAVGVEESVAPEVQEIAAEPGDLFLLCSDGLTDMVEDPDIERRLRENADDLNTASEKLVELANKNGGRDNISVVLARVVEPFPAQDRINAASELEKKIEITGKTDVGRRRSHNEDDIAIDTDAGIVMVADGMGGCNAGEIASAMAVQIIMRALREELESQAGADDELDFLAAAEDVDLDDQTAEQSVETVTEEFLDFVDNLDVGNWLEFTNADGSKTRGRLAWTSADSGRYLFTDLAGAKVVDATHHGLAMEVQRGKVKVIEGEPLVDRVMENVTERLESGELNALH